MTLVSGVSSIIRTLGSWSRRPNTSRHGAVALLRSCSGSHGKPVRHNSFTRPVYAQTDQGKRRRQAKTPQKLVPVLSDEDTAKLLAPCKGTTFTHLRDLAMIRLYANTGARLSEVGNLLLDGLDLNNETFASTARAPRIGGSDSARRPHGC